MISTSVTALLLCLSRPSHVFLSVDLMLVSNFSMYGAWISVLCSWGTGVVSLGAKRSLLLHFSSAFSFPFVTVHSLRQCRLEWHSKQLCSNWYLGLQQPDASISYQWAGTPKGGTRQDPFGVFSSLLMWSAGIVLSERLPWSPGQQAGSYAWTAQSIVFREMGQSLTYPSDAWLLLSAKGDCHMPATVFLHGLHMLSQWGRGIRACPWRSLGELFGIVETTCVQEVTQDCQWRCSLWMLLQLKIWGHLTHK